MSLPYSQQERLSYAKLQFRDNILPFFYPDEKEEHHRSEYGIAPSRGSNLMLNPQYYDEWKGHIDKNTKGHRNSLCCLDFNPRQMLMKSAWESTLTRTRTERSNPSTYVTYGVLQRIF